jgi:hypothetical protein
VQFRANQIISVAEARKLLGDEAKQMSDEEIQHLIDDFDILTQHAIKMVLKEQADNDSKVIK